MLIAPTYRGKEGLYICFDSDFKRVLPFLNSPMVAEQCIARSNLNPTSSLMWSVVDSLLKVA